MELIFVGAECELARSIHEWNQHQIQKTMLQKNVDWQFNPLAGSHYGGVWEKSFELFVRPGTVL